MRIWSHLFGRKDITPAPTKTEQFSRRMQDMEDRLNRLAREVDVIQRVDTDEARPE